MTDVGSPVVRTSSEKPLNGILENVGYTAGWTGWSSPMKLTSLTTPTTSRIVPQLSIR